MQSEQNQDNENAASHVDFADARTSVENTWRVDVAQATGAYRLADATAESAVIGTLATSSGTPWAQFRADLAAANQSWRTGQQGALVGTANALNLAETDYRTAVGPAYLVMAATQGSGLVTWTEAVNAAMVTQQTAQAAADELYQLSMAGPTEAYRIASAQAIPARVYLPDMQPRNHLGPGHSSRNPPVGKTAKLVRAQAVIDSDNPGILIVVASGCDGIKDLRRCPFPI